MTCLLARGNEGYEKQSTLGRSVKLRFAVEKPYIYFPKQCPK